jgi:hypothetical protein
MPADGGGTLDHSTLISSRFRARAVLSFGFPVKAMTRMGRKTALARGRVPPGEWAGQVPPRNLGSVRHERAAIRAQQCLA